MATALNPLIGYDKAAEIAKRSFKERRPVRELAREMTTLSPEEIEQALDPRAPDRARARPGRRRRRMSRRAGAAATAAPTDDALAARLDEARAAARAASRTARRS